jgi:hypothetical protein
MAVKTQYFWYFGMIGSRVMAHARMLPHRPACRKRADGICRVWPPKGLFTSGCLGSMECRGLECGIERTRFAIAHFAGWRGREGGDQAEISGSARLRG